MYRVHRLKNSLYNGEQQHKTKDWCDGYHEALNKVLDMLNEYSR